MSSFCQVLKTLFECIGRIPMGLGSLSIQATNKIPKNSGCVTRKAAWLFTRTSVMATKFIATARAYKACLRELSAGLAKQILKICSGNLSLKTISPPCTAKPRKAELLPQAIQPESLFGLYVKATMIRAM